MSVNPTLERLTSKSTGLLTNPFFEKSFGVAPAGSALPASVRVQSPLGPLGSPPGWRRFGNPVSIPLVASGSLPAAASRTSNPFWVSDDYDGVPGHAISVYPGMIGGLYQKLGGKSLVGRKVRISGAYRVIIKDYDSTPVSAGMSVWVKSDVKSAVSQGRLLIGTGDGSISGSPSAPTNVFTSASALTNVHDGDLLVIKGSSNVYQINADPTGSGPYTVTIDGYFTETIAAADWYISRRSPGGVARSANWMGARGVGITASPNRPAAILRVTEPGADWAGGMEWFCPEFDLLTYPGATVPYAVGTDGATSTTSVSGDTFTSAGATFQTSIPATAGTPKYTTYVYLEDLGVYRVSSVISNTELRLSGVPAYPTNGLSGKSYLITSSLPVTDASTDAVVVQWSTGLGLSSDEDISTYWPGVAAPGVSGGSTPNVEQAEIWFLDGNTWSGAAAGAQELVTKTTTNTSDVQYFDEVVEISSSLSVSAQDELYLVVMPIHPTDSTAPINVITVLWYGLSVELVPEIDSDSGVRDRLLRNYLDGALTKASQYRGGRIAQILRHPIYVPFEFALDPWDVRVKNEDFTDLTRGLTSGNHNLRFGDGSSRPVTSDELIWFLPWLPYGSFITRVDVKTSGTSAGDVNWSLNQTFAEALDYGADGPVVAVSETYLDTNPGTGVTFIFGGSPSLYRHRVGFPWPLSDDTDLPSVLESDHGYVPGRISLHCAPVSSTSSWDFTVEGIRVQGYADIRLLQGAPIPGII